MLRNLIEKLINLPSHKGKVSDEMEAILEDPESEEQLRRILASGEEGIVQVNGKEVAVTRTSKRAAGSLD